MNVYYQATSSQGLFSLTEVVFSHLHFLHSLDDFYYVMFFLEQHEQTIWDVSLWTAEGLSSSHSKTCTLHMWCENVFLTYRNRNTEPSEASLFQDQLRLSNSLFRSRAVKHQPLNTLPIVQLPWTIGWCNLTNKTNLHSTHLSLLFNRALFLLRGYGTFYTY